MSFPPRPPIGMSQMPPTMMSTGYTFTPMGMMPMGMGMMPPTTVMRPVVANTTTIVTKPKKQLVPQEIPEKEEKKEEKPPVTTVFVGNISERAPDSMIRTMLQRCGNVLSWKRVQGASGKLQAFGFCEYEDPDATLRCMRLLNDWQISDRKLVVKVDQKTKTQLDEWKKKKKAEADSEAKEEKDKKEENGGKDEDGEVTKDGKDDDRLDEWTKREDRVATAGLDAIMREYAFELAKEPSGGKQTSEHVSDIPKVPMPPLKKRDESQLKDTGLDDLNVEADTKDLINREIRSFRNLHKDLEDGEADREKEREREREKRIQEEQRRRRDKERELEKLRQMEKERYEREKTRRRESRSRSRSRSSSRGRSIRRSRSRERERERRARDRELEEEEEEAYERRKMEKKIREKELAYQERLKNWELRERKKAREYEKEREREEERKAEEGREARRLREFLEDYDDERDDPKFYKGSALERRLRERQKEKEADARDRAKEKEEMEEIRRKLLEDGHPDPEAEMAKIEREREDHLRPRLQLIEPMPPRSESEESEDDHPASPPKEESDDEKYPSLPNMKPTLQPVDESSQSVSATPLSADDEASRMSIGMSEDSQQVYGPSAREDSNSRLGFGSMKLGQSPPSEPTSGKRKKLTVGDVFNQEDDDSLDGAKKRKLVPLDYGDSDLEGKKTATAEEKRAKIKTLIENIPTAKDELFDYQLDWKIVDQSLMDKRIKPWVNKKIIEYIGEEEPTLTDFICQKVMAQTPPHNILSDVAMVLDEEAEVFVVKMWRLLVYETEAKKAGLVK